MFWDATKKYDIDLENSYAIGDKIRDLEICFESKVHGILLDENKVKNEEKFTIMKNLFEAAVYILERENNG